MHRIIKFRGQRTDNKDWIVGSLILKNGISTIISDNPNGNYRQFVVIPETVGQYTGLKDKNGTEIYEGDIITFNGITSRDKIIVGEVKFSEERLQYEYGKNGVWYPLYAVTMPIPRIIGNIHENPELLKPKL